MRSSSASNAGSAAASFFEKRASDSTACLLVVGEEQDAAFVVDRRVRRVERVDLVAEVLQPQVRDHLRLQQRDHVGGARDAMAGPHLLGHARSAEDVAALDHAGAQAGPREVGRRGEAVVAPADDDRVVVGRGSWAATYADPDHVVKRTKS